MIPSFIKNKISDVSIIGGGIIGVSIANELGKKGYNVTVFDKNTGVGDGTTSYSSGICRSYYSLFESVKLAHEGYQYWKNWEEYIAVKDSNGYASLKECGAIILKNSNSQEFINKTTKNMKALNIPFTHLDINETKKFINSLGWDLNNCYQPKRIDDECFGLPDKNIKMLGSVYFPQAGYISDPRLATQNLALSAKNNGVKFEFGREILGIDQKNGKVSGITLDDGEFRETSILVNAAGCYSSKINSLAFADKDIHNDMTLTTKPLRQEVAYVQLPKNLNYDNNGLIAVDFDLGIYFRPEIGNKLLIGGSEPDCDPLEYVYNLETMNTSFTDNWSNYVYRAALRIPELPIPTSKNVQGIVSTYDVTEDWTPIYDKSSLGGYYMAIGTSGNQFKNVGAVGNLMAKLINTSETYAIDLDDYCIKHHLEFTNQVLNVGKFSRKRNINIENGNVLG